VEDALTNALLRLYFEEDVSSDEEEDPVYPESSPGKESVVFYTWRLWNKEK
jgi:hypothetical protein